MRDQLDIDQNPKTVECKQAIIENNKEKLLPALSEALKVYQVEVEAKVKKGSLNAIDGYDDYAKLCRSYIFDLVEIAGRLGKWDLVDLLRKKLPHAGSVQTLILEDVDPSESDWLFEDAIEWKELMRITRSTKLVRRVIPCLKREDVVDLTFFAVKNKRWRHVQHLFNKVKLSDFSAEQQLVLLNFCMEQDPPTNESSAILKSFVLEKMKADHNNVLEVLREFSAHLTPDDLEAVNQEYYLNRMQGAHTHGDLFALLQEINEQAPYLSSEQKNTLTKVANQRVLDFFETYVAQRVTPGNTEPPFSLDDVKQYFSEEDTLAFQTIFEALEERKKLYGEPDFKVLHTRLTNLIKQLEPHGGDQAVTPLLSTCREQLKLLESDPMMALKSQEQDGLDCRKTVSDAIKAALKTNKVIQPVMHRLGLTGVSKILKKAESLFAPSSPPQVPVAVAPSVETTVNVPPPIAQQRSGMPYAAGRAARRAAGASSEASDAEPMIDFTAAAASLDEATVSVPPLIASQSNEMPHVAGRAARQAAEASNDVTGDVPMRVITSSSRRSSSPTLFNLPPSTPASCGPGRKVEGTGLTL